jgi:tetratricopeptide (TPR) repeat protein
MVDQAEPAMKALLPAKHRAILCADVEKFGDPSRTDLDRGAVRQGLYAALRRAFSASRIPWEDCYCEDRGDGVLFLIPPKIPKSLLVAPFPQELAAALRAYNQDCGPHALIRLRVALHAGEVREDANGVVASCINLAFRLLDADALKSSLRSSPGVLALIASGWFFDEVIKHDPAHRPETYERVNVTVKETSTQAWVCLPDRDDAAMALRVRGARESPDSISVPKQLPAAVGNFVGRTRELTSLTQLIEDGREHGAAMMVAAITGTAGVGKTALTVHWAHQVRGRFPDGNLYINLRGHDPGPSIQPDQALDRMLRTLDIPAEKIPAGLEAKAELYRSLLAGRRVLVVLDNAASDEQVRPLLPGTPGCVVVVTSRVWLSGLIARDGAHSINLNRLTKDEAIDLLSRIIGAEQVEAEQQAAAEVARWCAYLPLALRVAAERAAARPHSTLADVANELAGGRNRLNFLDTGDEFSTARSVFSWSYRALPSDSARAFRLLGLHPGPDICTRAAAALIGTIAAEARRLLEMLTAKHLLERTARDRFRLHDLLRCYADERARDEETDRARARAVRRVLVWYLHTAGNAQNISRDDLSVLLRVADDVGEPLTFTGYGEAQRWFEAERLNLMAAVREAAEGGHHDISWRLVVALGQFFYQRKYWPDLNAAQQIGLTSARQLGDRIGEGHILTGLAFARHESDVDESVGYYRQARAIFVETRDLVGEGSAICGLGHIARRLRRFDECIGYYRQALGIFRESNSRAGECFALIGLGYASGGLHDFTAAIDYFGRALDIVGGNRYFEGWAWHGLGYGCRSLHRFDEAVRHYQRALEIFREIDDLWGQGEAIYNLGKAHDESGWSEVAQCCWAEALSIFKDLQVPRESEIRARLVSLMSGDQTRSRPRGRRQ